MKLLNQLKKLAVLLRKLKIVQDNTLRLGNQPFLFIHIDITENSDQMGVDE